MDMGFFFPLYPVRVEISARREVTAFAFAQTFSVKNLPKLPTEGKEPEWEKSQGKRFNDALIKKFITFAFDHNAYLLRSAITYSVRHKS